MGGSLMARFRCADWIGPTVNEGDGDGVPGEPSDAMLDYRFVVEHIQVGTEAGTEAWQRNPASQVSSHFELPKVGRPRQMVDTHDYSWCQVAGNRYGLSVEVEGQPGDSLTPDQLEGFAQLCAEAHVVHGVPLQLCDDPTVTDQAHGGLIWHGAGGWAWGGHFDCPSPPIVAARPAIIARALEIVNGGILMALTDDQQAEMYNVLHALALAYDGKTGVTPSGWLPKVLEGAVEPSLSRIEQALAKPGTYVLSDADRQALAQAFTAAATQAVGAVVQPLLDAVHGLREVVAASAKAASDAYGSG